MLVWGAGARAQTAPTAEYDCTRLPPPGASVVQVQAHFDSLESHCLRNATYYRNYGQWLLQQNNPRPASEALERALLLEPEHLGTQMDYAQALLAVGDDASAQNILSALRALPDLPPHLMPLLDWQLRALQTAETEQAQAEPSGMSSKIVFSQSLGGDSNLNNATTATNVTLTYPDLEINLPVAKAYQPHAGMMTNTALQWTGVLPHGRQVWLFQAEGRARHTASETTRYQQAELHATWLQDPAASTQWIGRMEYAQVHWGGQKLYASRRLGLQHQWVHPIESANCRTAAGLEVEDRNYPTSRTLDGMYRGGVLTLVCQKQDSLNIQLRAGIDHPGNATRVGGQQQQTEIRAQWQTRSGVYQWLTEYTLQHQQDASGYSALLLRNAARSITRQALRVEASRPLDMPALGSPHWFGNIEISHQASNLQAFESKREAVQTGLRWSWP